MQNRQECLDYDKLPPVMKALIWRTPYSGCFGASAVIRYSFNATSFLPKIAFELQAQRYITSPAALSLMSDYTRATMQRAMAAWESVARVQFVEDDHKPQLYLFNFEPPSAKFTKMGFARSLFGHPGCIGINANISDVLNTTVHFDIALHEAGHILGLGHLFEWKFKSHAHFNFTTFSIMNYDHEYVNQYDFKRIAIEPVGLMPMDILGAQYIFGVKTDAHAGDDVYYLHQYDPKFSAANANNFFTITSLPWDSAGYDALSAEGVTGPVVMNIQMRGISSVNHAYVATPVMQIEKVIAGPTENAIVLNEFDNVADLRLSKRSLLFFSPEAKGHDVVLGFVPARDKIILETTSVDLKSSWNFTCTLELDNHIPTTIIRFSPVDTVSLIGVRPEQLVNGTIVTQFNPYLRLQNMQTNQYYHHVLHDGIIPVQFDHGDVIAEVCSMTVGTAVMLGTPKIVTHIMTQINMPPTLTNCTALATQCIPALVRGKFGAAGLIVLSNAAFDSEYAMHVNLGILLATLAYDSASPGTFVTKVVGAALSAVSGYGLAMFSSWGAKKIYDACVASNHKKQKP